MAKTKKARKARREYTAEEIERFREIAAADEAAADEAMTRPDVGARLASIVLAAPESFNRLATYSLRNQAMIAEQAANLGMDVTDVDTFAGWIQRGRIVRKGESAWLYIAGFFGDEAAKETDQDDGGKDEAGKARRPRFRRSARFELSQTTPYAKADAEAVAEWHETADAAPAAWLTRMTADAERIGYTITIVEGYEQSVTVDDETRTITVAALADDEADADTDRATLAGVAQALAERITATTAARKAKKTRKTSAEADDTPVLQMA